ncbi:MAG: toll/interleukin-1 receptor domain-containing protein [Deltaproteobacteria bacterium]|nr:toll/interleukin-1 receptor domain-containing protein [Deltaproteobacteria bacterium]
MNEKNLKQPSVFISYSHDSISHCEKVLSLSNWLRENGIDCIIDQYDDAPKEGWTVWMENQLARSEYILIVCTEHYFSTSSNSKRSMGNGVKFESLLSIQDLYDSNMINEKYIPILFEETSIPFIPRPLRSYTYYLLDNESGFDKLYRKLTCQPLVTKPPIGQLHILSTTLSFPHKIPVNGQNAGIYSRIIPIELILNDDITTFDSKKQNDLALAIRHLLSISGEVVIKEIKSGSVRVTLELEYEAAKDLLRAIKEGKLTKYKVDSAEIDAIPNEISNEAIAVYEDIYSDLSRNILNEIAKRIPTELKKAFLSKSTVDLQKLVLIQAQLFWYYKGCPASQDNESLSDNYYDAKRFISFCLADEIINQCINGPTCPFSALPAEYAKYLSSLTIEDFVRIKAYLYWCDRRSGNLPADPADDYFKAKNYVESFLNNCPCKKSKKLASTMKDRGFSSEDNVSRAKLYTLRRLQYSTNREEGRKLSDFIEKFYSSLENSNGPQKPENCYRFGIDSENYTFANMFELILVNSISLQFESKKRETIKVASPNTNALES